MKTLFTTCVMIFVTASYSQTSDTLSKPKVVVNNQDTLGAKDTTQILTFAEVMPQFPGGQDAFTKYLQDSIVYPTAERKAGKEGTVYVKFVVMRSGTIEGVKVLKGVSGAPGLSEESVRVIKSMPKWSPGTMNGKPVNVQMVVPLTFKLASRKKKKDKD
jgi:protein TonB